MQGLNLRGDPPVSDQRTEASPEEPLGLDLIRTWLAKPRPRLYRLWLWVPHTANGLRKAYAWSRVHGPPALRRGADRARKAAAVLKIFRRFAKRLANWFRTAFPPGSRGHEFGVQLLEANRGLGRAVLALLGISRNLDRGSGLLQHPDAPAERSPQPGPPPPGPAPATPAQTGPDEDAAIPGRMLPRPPGVRRNEPPRTERPAPGIRNATTADSKPRSGLPTGPRGDALAKLSTSLRVLILTLGSRPRKNALRFAIWRIVSECGPTPSEDLGLLLDVDPANLSKRHLGPMVTDGVLERTFPDRITHPEQEYRATGRPPG